eukprot:3939550-Rhodomonas_salina.2
MNSARFEGKGRDIRLGRQLPVQADRRAECGRSRPGGALPAGPPCLRSFRAGDARVPALSSWSAPLLSRRAQKVQRPGPGQRKARQRDSQSHARGLPSHAILHVRRAHRRVCGTEGGKPRSAPASTRYVRDRSAVRPLRVEFDVGVEGD